MTSNEDLEKKVPSTSAQAAKAKLRELFLRTMIELNGKYCSILTYEQSVLYATFCDWNLEGNELLVQELDTPVQVNMSCAILRAPDLLAIQFED